MFQLLLVKTIYIIGYLIQGKELEILKVGLLYLSNYEEFSLENNLNI